MRYYKLLGKPCLSPSDDASFDSGAILRRCVRRLAATGVLEMFYEARDGESRHAIGRATSKDGLGWDKLGCVFEPSTDAWDCGAVRSNVEAGF